MKTEVQQYLENSMRLFRENPVINWHEHIWESAPGVLNEATLQDLLFSGERTFTDTFLISTPVTGDPFCPPERFRAANDVVLGAVKRYPERLRGMCFINPGFTKEALEEIERCRANGFVGVKMYHQYRMDDPVQFPVIEKCIELDMPILMHAGKLNFEPESQPRISHGEYFANVARRYPEASLIMAHITGGGDWHWQLKAIEQYPSIVLDISGSVIDSPVIEECAARIGAERMLYGTDGSTAAGVGKILGAAISEEEKKTILAGTAYRRFLEKE